MDIKELIEEAGYESISYSGRGMFGKKCVAVSLDRGISEFKFIADLLVKLNIEDEQGEPNFQEVRYFADLIESTRMDAMGLGIVVYWPDEAWITESEKEHTDHSDLRVCQGIGCPYGDQYGPS